MTNAATPVTSTGPPRRIPVGITRDRLLFYLLLASVVLAFLQPTLGGVVRVTGSGDGCPDWPLCFGNWAPPWSDTHAIIEWSHRTVGALFGVIILLATARIWVRHAAQRDIAYTYSAALLLVIIVGGVGGAVVLSDLDPAIRTLHLLGAELVAGLAVLGLVLATHRTAVPGARAVPESYRGALRLNAIAAFLTLATLLTGAYAVWRGAGAVCPSWPLCGGPVIPQSELVWIQVAHRLLSIVAVLVVLYAAHRAFRLPDIPRSLRVAAAAVPVIITAQVLMGAANPWSGFSEWARAGHLSLATLVWVNMIFVVSLIVHSVPRRAGDSPAAGVNPVGPEVSEA